MGTLLDPSRHQEEEGIQEGLRQGLHRHQGQVVQEQGHQVDR